MKVWELSQFGLEHLRLAERQCPQPGAHEALVRIRAVSLNYRDVMTVRGVYNPRLRLPIVPASDGVGIVEAVGDHVSRVNVGQRVALLFAQAWISGKPRYDRVRGCTLGGPIDGTLQEYMVVPEQALVSVPEHLEDREAACLPCAALTAWSALCTEGRIEPGQSVLIQGSGGVSLFALQFALLHGARVFALSSDDTKLARMRELGAAVTLNYRQDPTWGATVRRLTDGVGVDHVVDVGGTNTLQQSLRAVRMSGTISLIGVLSGASAEIDLRPILMQQIRLQGILLGSRDGFEAMNRAIEAHALRPVLDDRRFGFHQTVEALEYLAAGRHFGKVTIAVNE